MRTQLKKITIPFISALIGAIVGSGIIAFAAWTGPLAAPPDGNVSAPVNVSGISQVKDGGLDVQDVLSANALAVFGDAIFSGATTTYANFGDMAGAEGFGFRNNNGVMEYKDVDGNWTSFASLSGGGGVSGDTQLYNGNHTAAECESAGGTVKSIGDGNYLCEFSGSSCESGWTQLNDWSSTA